MAKARRRTKSTDTQTSEQPAAPEPTPPAISIEPLGIVHAPAESAPEAAHENGHAPHSDHGHAASHHQHRERGQSHADAAGRRPPVVESGITFSATDFLAGVKMGEGFRLVGGKKVRDMVIKFDEKPSAKVIQMMHDADFKWLPKDKLWTHPIHPDSAWQARAHGEETFAAVTDAVRKERGITHSFGGAS